MEVKKEVEQHRRECEARWVLSQIFENRKPYLNLVGKRRGRAAQMELEKEVMQQQRDVVSEARRILLQPTINERRQCLDMAEEVHGATHRRLLEAEIMKQWKESRN